MLEKYDNILFGKGKFGLYPLSIFFIIYFDKGELNKVYYAAVGIIIITLLGIILIILPRKYFMKQIIFINNKLYFGFPFILKIRKIFIHVPKIIQVIVSSLMYVDIFLKKLFFLETRNNNNVYYFFRNFIYCNLIMMTILPFYFIKELYKIILDFCEAKIDLKDYIQLRIEFLILTIIFILLINKDRVDIIIYIGIIDTLITFYYTGIKNGINMHSFDYLSDDFNIELDGRMKSILLEKSFNEVGMIYNIILNDIILNLNPKRDFTILLFKGLDYSQIFNLKFNFYKQFELIYEKFGSQFYLAGVFDKAYSTDYFKSKNDLQYILSFLDDIFDEFGNDQLAFIKMLDTNIHQLMEDTFSVKFHKTQYFLMIKVLIGLKNNKKLIDDFLNLKKIYTNFGLFNDYTENEKIIKFFDELGKSSSIKIS